MSKLYRNYDSPVVALDQVLVDNMELNDGLIKFWDVATENCYSFMISKENLYDIWDNIIGEAEERPSPEEHWQVNQYGRGFDAFTGGSPNHQYRGELFEFEVDRIGSASHYNFDRSQRGFSHELMLTLVSTEGVLPGKSNYNNIIDLFFTTEGAKQFENFINELFKEELGKKV